MSDLSELFAAAERRVGGIPRDEMSKAERLIDDLAAALAAEHDRAENFSTGVQIFGRQIVELGKQLHAGQEAKRD